MCDTLVALPGATAGGRTLFGKNSDRQRNEAQVVERHLAREHESDARVSCTYISVPQARRTNAVLLCRPFWGWGAEMGANEYGVVIGNEAVHARSPAPQAPALTGMDLVRLTLERSDCAAAAVEVLTGLLERYGQGGNCGHLVPHHYNNGFLIADATEAYAVETLERDWLVERVERRRSLSNVYSIGRGVMRRSASLDERIRAEAWGDPQAAGHAAVLADPAREHLGSACARLARSAALLQARDGRLQVADVMRILRDHGEPEEGWRPRDGGERTLCMHAAGPERQGQTTGSLVSEIGRDGVVHWVTATAAPCISLFKPVWLDLGVPAHGPPPTDHFDPAALWWRHEQLHRGALASDFAAVLGRLAPERDALEARFRELVAPVAGADAMSRRRVMDDCWRMATEAESRWLCALNPVDTPPDGDAAAAAWREHSQLAGAPV